MQDLHQLIIKSGFAGNINLICREKAVKVNKLVNDEEACDTVGQYARRHFWKIVDSLAVCGLRAEALTYCLAVAHVPPLFVRLNSFSSFSQPTQKTNISCINTALFILLLFPAYCNLIKDINRKVTRIFGNF